MNNSTQEENTVQPSPRPSRRLQWVLWSVLAVILLILTGATVLTASVFSSRKHLPLQPLTAEDLRLQQKLIRQLSVETFKRQERRKEAVLVLKTSELESLFRLIDYGFSAAKLAGRYDGPEPRYFEPVFGRGHIQAVYPLNTGFEWLFGGVMRWQVTATPRFENNMLSVKIHNCRLGIVPLPRSLSEKIMFKILARLHSSREYKYFCKIFKKIHLQRDGSLVVIYSPKRLLALLTYQTMRQEM
ncbi:MAG: hypothetical protein IKC65_03825 [Lentisphaeria bacterium]|nr:hypothetical protein [Lentisphaeria bacterium]